MKRRETRGGVLKGIMPFLSGREEEMRREKSRLEQKASVNRRPKRAKVSRHKRKAAV